MKLFQRLLVAPAALGLISPIAANATEINLNEISNYSTDVENIEFVNSFDSDEPSLQPLLAGGEGLVDGKSSYDGSFSSTTTASFSVDFAIGAVDGKDIQNNSSTVSYNKGTDGDEDLQATYGFQIDLNTSFSGEDSLDISLDAGNGATTSPLAEFDLNGGDNTLAVDGVSYTFPLAGATVIVGDNTDGSALFNIACVYGGPSNTLDDCGAVKTGITSGGVTVGASYDIGNGFTAAAGFQFTETGIATKENEDTYALNVAYTADTYGASLTYASYESGTENNEYTAINAYWTPEGFPSISAGYETGSLGGEAAASDEALAYFIGIETEVGPGTFGAALGTQGSAEESSSKITEEMMYEAYYSYEVNDGMTITPLIYMQEDKDTQRPDRTGIMVKTSFSF